MTCLKAAVIAVLWIIIPLFSHAYSDKKITIKTANETLHLSVQLAKERGDLMQGLMHRSTLEPYDGMLFDFGYRHNIKMWMKNTILPLDMLFISEDGRINHIAHNTVPYSTEIIASPHASRYVLELLAGDAKKRGIAAGDQLLLGSP